MRKVLFCPNQLKTQDLDECKFLDFMEIGQLVPEVLEYSPVLYSYVDTQQNKPSCWSWGYNKGCLQENESSQGLKEIGETNHLGLCEVQDKN